MDSSSWTTLDNHAHSFSLVQLHEESSNEDFGRIFVRIKMSSVSSKKIFSNDLAYCKSYFIHG